MLNVHPISGLEMLTPSGYGCNMVNVAELFSQASQLPERERAMLASEILSTLSPILEDADEGLEEAKRRSREMDENPEIGISWEELKDSLGR